MIEKWIELPDGSQKCFDVRIYPIHDRSVEKTYVVKMGFDITDRKLASDKQSQYMEALEISLKRFEKNQSHSTNSTKSKNRFNLTKRETEVIRLVSEGLSNSEISGQLLISPHTVKTHVTHILNKIGVADRTQAAVLAARLGII